jgi:uncharacterized protein
MSKSVTGTLIVLGVVLTACTQQSNSNAPAQEVNKISNKTTSDMKNLVSIIEIPTADFPRAVAFYQAVLDINIEEVEMDGIRMGLFPNTGEGISVQLIHGNAYKTSADGALVYLNGGDDLQKMADKIKTNGGKIILPKTEIGPDMGFYAMFTDTEGNRLGLYSNK